MSEPDTRQLLNVLADLFFDILDVPPDVLDSLLLRPTLLVLIPARMPVLAAVIVLTLSGGPALFGAACLRLLSALRLAFLLPLALLILLVLLPLLC